MAEVCGGVGVQDIYRLLVGSIVAVCIVGAVGLVGWAQLAVLNTETGLTFVSIQEAVDHSTTTDGDVILVDSLNYDSGDELGVSPNSLLVITKSVTIRSTLGAEHTVIDASGWRSAFWAEADGVVFEGFTILGSTWIAVVVWENRCELRNLIVRLSEMYGIVLWPGTSGAVIEYNLIDGSGLPPCGSEDHWTGISVESSSDNIIRCNEIVGTCMGISLIGDSDRNRIRRNSIQWCEDTGIHVSSTTDPFSPGEPWHNTIADNTIWGGITGIICHGDVDFTTIAGNTVAEYVHLGIALHDSLDGPASPDNNQVTGNTLRNGVVHGISLWGATMCTVAGNDISGIEDHGIYVHASSDINVNSNTIRNILVIAIAFGDSTDCTASGNDIEGGECAIFLVGSATTSVTNNNIVGSAGRGIGSMGPSQDNEIVGNVLTSCEAGMNIEGFPGIITNTLVQGNTVTDCNFGMFLGGVANIVENNVFENYHRTGIQPTGSDHIVRDNTLLGAADAGCGIFLIGSLEPLDEEGTRITIERNAISGGRRGIILYMGRENTVQANTVTGHLRQGILLSLADNNLIEGNAVTENGCGFTIPYFGSMNNTIRNNTLTGNANGAVLTKAPSTFFTTSQALSPLVDSLGNEYLGNTPDPLTSCATPVGVALDIKPCSCPNPLNTTEKGVLPVAVLGSADLDVREIDSATLTLAGVPLLRDAYEDVAGPYEPLLGRSGSEDCTTAGPDGYEDLVLKFNPQEIVSTLETTVVDRDVVVLELTGFLFDGTPIVGEDVMIILDEASKTQAVAERLPLRIMAAPNPVEEFGVEFRVEGGDAVQLSVRIFDLSGKEIFASGLQPGATFVWPLVTGSGERVANGVYLCRVTAFDAQGAVLKTEVKLVAVTR